MSRLRFVLLSLFVLSDACAAVLVAAPPPKIAAPRVSIVLSKTVQTEPFTGRVFVFFSKEPITGVARQNWFKPHPFFAQDVVKLAPETPHAFKAEVGLPAAFAEMEPGKYHVQAIVDRDLGGQSALSAAGNLFSKPAQVELGAPAATLTLVVDQVVPVKKFVESERVKLVDIPSGLLTKFHGKPIRLRAAVLLPKSYAEKTDARYPVIYEIPGFSGDHHHFSGAEKRNATEVAGVEMIHVTLDPSCRLGHHVFADSANNGPCGQALIEELIPVVEQRYRAVASPHGRFVTGHSSGGWSSLWLQVTYPDTFGGCWSTAPDSVDFRDFQLVNIYPKGTNLLFDEKRERRPLGRRSGKPVLYYKPFSDMEVVLGRGGQLFSFEAVFSPKGKDGKPAPLYDHRTGAIDPEVAEAWKKYDINLVLREKWKTIGPRLGGKIHIYMGGEDTFYLDGATRLVQKTLKELGSDAVVEIFPGKDHGTLMTGELRQRIAREMAAAYSRK